MTQVADLAIAINTFVKGCKTDGTWDAIKACCIMAAWDGLDGALYPLKGTAPTNFNFVSGDYNRETGLVGDGSTKYLDSNRNNNADPQNSQHMALYITQPSNVNAFHIGCGTYLSVGAGQLLNSSTGDYTARIRASGAISTTIPYNASSTFLGASRSLSSEYLIRALGSTIAHTYSSEVPANDLITVFKAGSSYSSIAASFYSIGESLDLALLDNRVSTLMTDIGAAIP